MAAVCTHPCLDTRSSPMPNERKRPAKTVDVPPRGGRNLDPITKAPGAHPIEVGVGTALGGAAAGLAAGAAAGPVGAVIGAVVGGGAGGDGGEAGGGAVDPTTEDTWLRDSFGGKKDVDRKSGG